MLDEMTFFEVFRWVISSSKHTSLVSEEKMVLPKYFTKKTVLHPQVSRFVSTLYLHTPHHDDGSHFSNLGFKTTRTVVWRDVRTAPALKYKKMSKPV